MTNMVDLAFHLVNDPGNLWVKNSDLYPYPSKPVPVPHGYGFTQMGVEVCKNLGVNMTCSWGSEWMGEM